MTAYLFVPVAVPKWWYGPIAVTETLSGDAPNTLDTVARGNVSNQGWENSDSCKPGSCAEYTSDQTTCRALGRKCRRSAGVRWIGFSNRRFPNHNPPSNLFSVMYPAYPDLIMDLAAA